MSKRFSHANRMRSVVAIGRVDFIQSEFVGYQADTAYGSMLRLGCRCQLHIKETQNSQCLRAGSTIDPYQADLRCEELLVGCILILRHEAMRIATFNLESLDVPPKAAVSLEDRIAILRPQLVRMAADIVCFQEINTQRENAGSERRLLALELLLQETPYAEFERSVTGIADGRGMADVHNLVVLSRFPILDSGEFWNKFVDAPLYRCATAIPVEDEARPIGWDRPILKTLIQLDDVRMLHVLNAHLRAPLAAPVAGQKDAPFVWSSTQGWAEGYFLAAIKRTGQALELRLAIDQIFDSDPDALIAVCGDLNAEDHETALRIVLASEEDTGSGRLATRSLVPLERSIAKDRRFTTLHHGRALMPDHIIVSRSLLGFFRHIEIHNEPLSDELVAYAKTDRPPDSFHAPIVAEFALD